MKRTRLLALVLVGMVLAAAGGWLAGTSIQSPAEAAARTTAPDPSPILVPVELRELSTDIITRGTGRFGKPQSVSLAPSRFKADAPVVTSISAADTELQQGDVVATVRGRPVFVMVGTVPAFRDVGPGTEGVDVAQLESALAGLGLDPGPVDGRYDAATGAAVGRLYEGAGFTPLVLTDEQIGALLPPERTLFEGERLEAGIAVPADEVVFVPALPVRVSETSVGPGGVPAGPLLTVSDAEIAIDTSVPIETAALVGEGMVVSIDEPDLGIEAEGVVARVAPGPGTDGVDGFHVYVEVAVPDAPAALVNASVRLTLSTESTGGPVLAVPVSALTLDTDGSSRIQVSQNGSLTFVAVEPGLSADGFVELRTTQVPVTEGDLVVVGFELAS